MSSTRQIAVIMFTDIVGYTAMMGKNEKEALSLLRKNKEIHNKWLKQFNGKWLKEMGDGILASFQTISDAVYCAGSILKETETIDKLHLRIGIHLGEVEVDGNELYGDGVNIASRIEGIAESGQLLVSETIYNNIRNKEGVETTFLGEHDLKNVGHPVKIYAVEVTSTPEKIRGGPIERVSKKSKWIMISASMLPFLAFVYYVVLPFLKEGITSTSETFSDHVIEKSVAVLPFKDMSPNKDQEYLGDGIAEEILNVLAQRKGLKVIGRTSSFSYKGKETDLKTIGVELGVATILEGSVRKDGNQIRITAQFINAEDGSHLWSATFDRELKDIFRLQDEIADSVSRSLLLSLNIPDQENKTRENIVDNEAYNLYLQGRFYKTKADDIGEDRKKNMYKAIDYFNQAIAIDSGFVDAYAELAATYGSFGFFYGDREISNVWQLAENYAIKTLELDKANVPALRTMGAIKRNRYWDWESARGYYQRTLSSAPGNARAMREYSLLLSAMNQQDSATYYAEKSLSLNPTSDEFKTGVMRAAYYSRNYPEAIYQSGKIATLTGESYFFLLLVFVQANKEKAVQMILEDLENAESKKALEKTYRDKGWKSFLQEIIHSDVYFENFNTENRIFIEVTPKDEIFKKLNRDAKDKVGNLVYLLADPIFDPLRSDPRFDELLQMMGLDKYK